MCLGVVKALDVITGNYHIIQLYVSLFPLFEESIPDVKLSLGFWPLSFRVDVSCEPPFIFQAIEFYSHEEVAI